MIPAIASRDAGECQVARPAPGGGPQPTDHQDRGGVLQQQRDADRQVRDGVEVAQLRAGDRDQPVGDDGLAVLQGFAEPVGLDDRGEDGHQQRAAGEPGGDRGGRAPAGLHQRLGERSGGTEGEGGGHREQQAEPEVITVGWVVAMGAPPGCNE